MIKMCNLSEPEKIRNQKLVLYTWICLINELINKLNMNGVDFHY